MPAVKWSSAGTLSKFPAPTRHEPRPSPPARPQRGERAGAVADEGDAHIHALEERGPEIGHGRFVFEAHMASGGDCATAVACQQDREVVVVVAVAVDVAAALGDAVVEQRAVAFADGLQPLKRVGELRDVKLIDRAHLPDFLRIVPVVEKLAVAFVHAEFGVAFVAALPSFQS